MCLGKHGTIGEESVDVHRVVVAPRLHAHRTLQIAGPVTDGHPDVPAIEREEPVADGLQEVEALVVARAFPLLPDRVEQLAGLPVVEPQRVRAPFGQDQCVGREHGAGHIVEPLVRVVTDGEQRRIVDPHVPLLVRRGGRALCVAWAADLQGYQQSAGEVSQYGDVLSKVPIVQRQSM